MQNNHKLFIFIEMKTNLSFKNFLTKLSKLLIFIVFLNVISINLANAQNNMKDAPVIGAQVIIEPGQTPEEIDTWFRILSENNLKVCRIRMFEMYMHKPDNTWDYTLFDLAFKAAEKYGIKVFATLFPVASDNSVGGFKFPESDEHFQSIANCIKNMATHFKQFSSFYGWVLINEPGVGGSLPNTEYTAKKFKEWKSAQIEPEYQSKGYTKLVSFDNEKFLLDYTTWFLGWIANEIHKYDTGRHLHVNNHQVFMNVAEYNFPEWRKFLTTLGASAHPSWHFGYFNRNEYAKAMSANCDIIRSGAGNIPFWVTELQGGNNTYSGLKAFCPTKEEISQWLWTSIGTGAQGIIFWSLNPRSIGEEAGEWALINFQNEPSDRLSAAKDVSTCLDKNKALFANAQPIESGINILYIRESLWAEKVVQYSKGDDSKEYEGRMTGGVMKSALAYYETLLENGINSNFKEISEFDWNQNEYTGKVIILANQISVPSRYWAKLTDFVSKGGKLIVDGITFFYDENMLSLMNTGFPLEKLMGGTLSEVKCIPGDFTIALSEPRTILPVHLWKGYIKNTTGKAIALEGNLILGNRNIYGKGETVWIPSMIGLGARRNDNSKLSEFIKKEVRQNYLNLPIRFKTQQKGVLVRTMQSEKSFITIIINKSKDVKNIQLDVNPGLKPTVLFAEKTGKIIGNMMVLPSEETLVVLWQ